MMNSRTRSPAPPARLVPVLDGEVVPELRQLSVGADLAGVERERLLVREGQEDVPGRSRGTAWGPCSRPDACQSSIGADSGHRNSCAPIASISSRDDVHLAVQVCPEPRDLPDEPAPRGARRPTASASAGSSRRVGRKSCDARAANDCSLVVERDQRRLGHGEAANRHSGTCSRMPSPIHPSISEEQLVSEIFTRVRGRTRSDIAAAAIRSRCSPPPLSVPRRSRARRPRRSE